MATSENPQTSGRVNVPTVVNPAIKSKHEHLITELEVSEGHIDHIITEIYQGDNDPKKFLGTLDEKIKVYDGDIEKICSQHYHGFVKAVQDLQSLSSDCQSVKREVVGNNNVIRNSLKVFVECGAKLVKERKYEQNMQAAMEALSNCLPVLDLYVKLREQVMQHRYYPALKSLEQLESTYLPRVYQYHFSKEMKDQLPVLRKDIEDVADRDLKDFLESVSRNYIPVGELAISQVAEELGQDPQRCFINSDASYKDKGVQDIVDFSPVYRSAHIHSILKTVDSFERYYREERIKQANLVLDRRKNMLSLENWKRILLGIVGFFVIEDHVMATTDGLIDRNFMDTRWSDAVEFLKCALKTNLPYAEANMDYIFEVRNLIALFCQTMKSYGFGVSEIQNSLVDMKEMFSHALVGKSKQTIAEILANDNYTAITVETEEEYDAVFRRFPFDERDTDKSSTFPRRLPFSDLAPQLFQHLNEHVVQLLEFTHGMNLSRTDTDDIIRKSINSLLDESIQSNFAKLLGGRLQLLQLIQLSINLYYLENSGTTLQNQIAALIGASEEQIHSIKLTGFKVFQVSRYSAESKIPEKINERIDEFIGLAEYDWEASEAIGHASDYILDMISFLKTIFETFTNLPHKLNMKFSQMALEACRKACEHVAKELLHILLNPDVKVISSGALQQFELDLCQCETFANSAPIPDLREEELTSFFYTLRQLLDLVINKEWATYLADYGKDGNKYAKVTPKLAIALLEKTKESYKGKNNLFTFNFKNQKEKDEKKLTEAVLKELRGLTNGHA